MDEEKSNESTGERPETIQSKGSPEEEADGLENGDDKIKANLEVFREFNKHCKSLALCPRCQLRYLGEHYSSVSFSLAQDEVNKVS